MASETVAQDDPFDYNAMIETALRGVVREALLRAARDGLPGEHHFYIGFRTGAAGVVLPDYLAAKYPDEMTIVLQHQFWDLRIDAAGFSVALTFQNRPERLTIPFAAITSFADPSVKFGLQFQPAATPAAEIAGLPAPAAAAAPERPAAVERPDAEIVALDKFRKR